MECQVQDETEVLASSIESFERRVITKEPATLDEIKELERRVEPYRRGPHYQLAQRVRKLAQKLGHVDSRKWEEVRSAPAPIFTLGERSYIGRLASTKGAPVEIKIVYDHLFLTTNYLATIGSCDLVKITHRFNREGRLDLIDARLKQTRRANPDGEWGAPPEDTIFHLVQSFAFKDKLPEPEWTESRCEYFIRIRQIAAVFYDLGFTQEETQFRFIIQRGNRLMRELNADLQCGSLREVRVVRTPFFPISQLPLDEAAAYIIGKAAAVEPRVSFDTQRVGGHLGDLRIRYAAV